MPRAVYSQHMDELQISGKRYISSRRVARENGYTSDYIGQLIRAGKITGQKVGRAWYVDAASFDAYLGAEGITNTEESAEFPAEVSKIAEDGEVVQGATEPEEVAQPALEEVLPVMATEVQSEEDESEVNNIAVRETKEEEIPSASEEIKNNESVYHIPLHVVAREETKDTPAKNDSGLRYYADEEPLLPEISRNKKESRVDSEALGVARKNRTEIFAPAAARSHPMYAASLLITALAILAISAYVSSALSLNLSIEAGNTATAVYSIDWMHPASF